MSKKSTAILMLSITICLTVLGFSLLNNQEYKKLNIPMPGQEIPKINYEYQATESALPTEATIYKFIAKDGKKESQKIAELLEYKEAPKFDSDSNKYSIKAKDTLFEYENETSHWSFKNIKALDDTSKNKQIPTDQEAITIAKNAAKKYGILDDRFTNIKIVPQSTGDKTTNDYAVIYKDIYFYPTVNDMPVYGISRIIVSIGDKGEVIAISKYYKDIMANKKVKLRDAKNAFEDVKNNKASNNIDPSAKKAKITKVQLGYWEDAESIKKQPHLQPVWIFVGEAEVENNGIKEFDAIVPAIE